VTGVSTRATRSPFRRQDIGRPMPLGHPLDENGIALGVVRTQRQDVLVRGRFVSVTGALTVGERDDDHVPSGTIRRGACHHRI
jgi:hypothetical protein